MAKELNKTSGEPPRLKVPRPGTKPLLVVTDDEGQPVLDLPHYLAWHKSTGTFYVGGSHPREYLKTHDRPLAMLRYRGWVLTFRGKRVTIKHAIGDTTDRKLTDSTRLKRGLPPFDYEQPALTSLPDHVFWKKVRQVILDDPKLAAKQTGIKELGYLTDLQPPKPSVKLAIVLNAYLNKRRQPSEDEIKKVKRYWKFFVSAISPAKTIQDIDETALTRWEDKAYAKYNNDGSPKTLAHRFEYVQRLFNYAIKKQIDTDECKRVVAEIVSAKTELPDLRNLNPNPISVDDFHKLLSVADEKWTAILLTAMNLCYYPVDIRTIPTSAVDFDSGVIIFDRAKTGQTTRVGILWERTKDALQAYLQTVNHNKDSVFITQYGTPYTAQGLRTVFRFFRDKTDLDHALNLAHIRDGAYSAAIEGGATETIAKILAGHKISGMSDAYIKRNPKMVAEACIAIEKHFFGNEQSLKRSKT